MLKTINTAVFSNVNIYTPQYFQIIYFLIKTLLKSIVVINYKSHYALFNI